MRYSKIALLTFGLGLLLGLVVVAVEIRSLERVSSGLMALGIAAIPIAVVADWRRSTRNAQRSPRRRASATGRRVPPAARRPRKSATRKR